MRLLFIFLLFPAVGLGQTNTYKISFENAVHHEAVIQVTFPEVKQDTLEIRMSRTSPGRYALHEFAKNVYGLSATDSKGKDVKIIRQDPYSWLLTGHEGEINVKYNLFGNRADGTYTQIDETHAHLNIPATFMYSEALKNRPIELHIDTRHHPQWKIATQLKKTGENKFYAPDLYYFMDSPIEASNFGQREFNLDGQKIEFVLHHPGTEQELDEYFSQVKSIVRQQKEVFGELPEFDFGRYTFLACYMPQVSGDGMEHRNSTVLTRPLSLGEGGMKGNIGTVAHEFFHAWNVERLRPASLEPFDFSEANMSGALWFAEGFTSYYTGLTLARGNIITPASYAESLNGTFNYVWNSPATRYFNPVEMSYQAPFVDAATSVDPVNRENTFISYYSYGSVLGLALDLHLRKIGLSLDGYMKTLWNAFGKSETPYHLEDLEDILSKYAGNQFAETFFETYIYKSGMPDYEDLFNFVGFNLQRKSDAGFSGISVKHEDGKIFIANNPKINTPAYEAGLDIGDEIISLDGMKVQDIEKWKEIHDSKKPGDRMRISINRHGENYTKTVNFIKDPTYHISLDPEATKIQLQHRAQWLSGK